MINEKTNVTPAQAAPSPAEKTEPAPIVQPAKEPAVATPTAKPGV